MTIDTAAKSTFLLSYAAGDGEDESSLSGEIATPLSKCSGRIIER